MHFFYKTKEILIFLTICLGIILMGLIYYSHIQDRDNEKYLKIVAQKEREKQDAQMEIRLQEEIRHQEQIENESFYEKISDGFDANILIVGDSIGAGVGASDDIHRWTNVLKSMIEAKYNIVIEISNISLGGNTSYAGYVTTEVLDSNRDYDLVLLCYGQNDKIDNFGLYYESIICAVKQKYPKASIMCILESSQREYTEKMQIIETIADHYGLPVVDTIAPFKENYESLSNDGVHPNDRGHRVYAETVMNVIGSLIEERRGYDPERVPTMNEKVSTFDSFQWIGAEQFTRKGNTYVINTTIHGKILGINYNFVSGENSCQIFIDGVEYVAPEVSFNYDFSQRHIMIVNHWLDGEVVDVKNEIRVVFDEGEVGTMQADGFNGLAISGLYIN